MIKRKIIETICEYGEDGNLLKKTIIETHEEDDNTYVSNTETTICDTSNN